MRNTVALLVIIALIAGMMACEATPVPDPDPDPAQYSLTISSTDGGSVTIPGEGSFTYDTGTVVDLVAEAEEGYRFVDWTGDVDAVEDANAAATTIIVDSNTYILASFATDIDYSDFGKLTRIEADAGNGFHWAYYLYVPDSLRAPAELGQPIYVLVEPNNTGYPHDDQQVHDFEAMRLADRRADFAEQLKVALLVPTFPRPATEWDHYIHALDRNTMLSTAVEWERVDLQLIRMVDDARLRLSEKGVTTQSRMLMMGYSASAMFVNRFAVMHPTVIQAAAIGAPGGWPIAPVAHWEDVALRYPIGVADIEDITGDDFSIEELKQIPLYFYMGDMDTNDSVPYFDGWDAEDQELIFEHFGETPVERWPIAEHIYESAGCNSQFVLYAGIGHQLTTAMLADIIQFFSAHMDS